MVKARGLGDDCGRREVRVTRFVARVLAADGGVML